MRFVFCGGLSGQGEDNELSSSKPSTQNVGGGTSFRGVSLRRLLKRWRSATRANPTEGVDCFRERFERRIPLSWESAAGKTIYRVC